MALNFPKSPTLNEEYPAGNGITYVWDGSKWTARGTETGIPILPDENGNVVITGTLTVQGTTITGNSLTVTDITGVSADISGSVTAGSGNISGDLSATNATLSGNLNAVDSTLSGNLNAVNSTLSGDLSAADLTAANADLSGNLNVAGDIDND